MQDKLHRQQTEQESEAVPYCITAFNVGGSPELPNNKILALSKREGANSPANKNR